MRLADIESDDQQVRTLHVDSKIRGGVAGGPRDSGDVERAAISGRRGREGGQERSRVGHGGRVDSHRVKDRSINRRRESPSGQGHVLRVPIHPAVGRQPHEVGGAGTPRTSFLPDETSDVGQLLLRYCSLEIAESVSRGQCEIGQAGAAVFDLLCRYARGRGRRHAFRQRTIELRPCRAGAARHAGEEEQANHGNQGRPDFPCCGRHGVSSCP